eukprot:m.33419 g.33419  ORF g.33419 m.33419 type:complete len:245 (-) comp6448_c1_seq2:1654-2388(-)
MTTTTPAIRKLQKELKDLEKEPLDGVVLNVDDESIFHWSVGLFGPPDTPFAGGYFKASIDFPESYPFSPPKMKFTSRVFHPNVYPTGEICISILHPPGEDDMSGERPEERWNPTQTVRTILLSVISLLNEPNTSSPANVDANVAYLKYMRKESSEYLDRVTHDVEISKKTAEEDSVEIPLTMDDYMAKSKLCLERQESVMTSTDFVDSDADSDFDDTYDFDHNESSAEDDDDEDDDEDEEKNDD